MHSKSDTIKIMINNEANEVVKELYDSHKNRYQNNLESMKGSEFVYDYLHLLYYKYHKIDSNRGESYLNSPDWMKIKGNYKFHQQQINNKYYKYTATVALNHEQIK